MSVQKQTKPSEPEKIYRWIVFWTGVDYFGHSYVRITTEETKEDLLAYDDSSNQGLYSLRARLAQDHNFLLAEITNVIERR